MTEREAREARHKRAPKSFRWFGGARQNGSELSTNGSKRRRRKQKLARAARKRNRSCR